jgi:endonuclease YncB( thermonuclease family)
MTADQPPPFVCRVVKVTDADTYRCQSGVRIRLAGAEANERKGGCHLPVCPPLPHARAKPIAERLVLHKTLTCQPVGRSFKRVVASCRLPDGQDTRCQLTSSGATVDWPAYVTRYGLKRCGR